MFETNCIFPPCFRLTAALVTWSLVPALVRQPSFLERTFGLELFYCCHRCKYLLYKLQNPMEKAQLSVTSSSWPQLITNWGLTCVYLSVHLSLLFYWKSYKLFQNSYHLKLLFVLFILETILTLGETCWLDGVSSALPHFSLPWGSSTPFLRHLYILLCLCVRWI